jgi:hypothetical protein
LATRSVYLVPDIHHGFAFNLGHDCGFSGGCQWEGDRASFQLYNFFSVPGYIADGAFDFD